MEDEKDAAAVGSRWSREQAEKDLLSALKDTDALITSEKASHARVLSALASEDDASLKALLEVREESRHVNALGGLHDRRLRVIAELNRLNGLYGDKEGGELDLPVFEGEEDIQE
jgi:hypothetical protein